MYKLTKGWPQHIDSGAFVNPDSNIDYLAWLAKGNTPEPDVPPPTPVPTKITMRQARLALFHAGLLTQVNAAIAQATDDVKIEWEYAQEIERNWPTLVNLTAFVGLTSEQVDELFFTASIL